MTGRETPKKQFVEVDGARMACYEMGTGNPIVPIDAESILPAPTVGLSPVSDTP